MDVNTLYHAAALMAALCWAVGPFLAFSSSKQLGAFPFNRWRMGSLALLFSAVVLLRALFTDHTTFAFPMTDVLLLLLSGFVGVFLGDSALFAALRRLGPRRNAMIFSTHAPMTFFLGWLVLAQIPTTFEWIGVAMIFSGVLLAIFYGGVRTGKPLSHYETTLGGITIALVFGLCAASGQAVGALIAHPVMRAGADPLDAALLRILAAAGFYMVTAFIPYRAFHSPVPIDRSHLVRIVGSGIVGMGFGTTFLLIGLKGDNAGVTATLMSLSPVLILPILWVVSRQCPPLLSWVGAIMASIGSALLFA